MAEQYHDSEWLRKEYHDKEKTQREIAEECDVSSTTIRKLMKKHGLETRKPVGKYHGLYGKERSEDTKIKISRTLKGREFSVEWRSRISEAQTGTTLPETTRRKISESLEGLRRPEATRRKMSEARKGDSNPMWKGGIGRTWYDAVEWRSAKAEVRNNQPVCQICQHDGTDHTLDVHHIVPIRLFAADEAISVTDAHHMGNLIRLCRQCHARAESGDIIIQPNFKKLPERLVIDVFRLWQTLLESFSD